jgi:hypothetical protein
MGSVVFTDRNWRLIRDWAIVADDNGKRVSPIIPWIGLSHHCYGENWGHKVSWFHLDKGICGHCGEEIPKEIIGLQALANWDKR